MKVIKANNKKLESGDVICCINNESEDYYMIARDFDDNKFLVALGSTFPDRWTDGGSLTVDVEETAHHETTDSIENILVNLKKKYNCIKKVDATLKVTE